MCAAGGTFVTATGIGVSEFVEDVVLDACVLAVWAAPAVVLDACVLTARARPLLALAAAAAEGAWRASEASSASAAVARERIERA
jgi:hypothetical protein